LKSPATRHAVAVAAAFSLSVAFVAARVGAQNQGQNAQPNRQSNAPAPKAAAAPAAPAAEPQVDPNKVVLTIGDEKVTAGQVEALIADLPAQQQQLLRRAGRRVLADELVRIKLLSQEAQKRKLDQTDKVRRQLELTRDQILASAVASDAMRQAYEADKTRYEKIRARHILIRTPGSRAPVRPGQKELTEPEAKAKADDLRKQLVAGADFAEVARKESDDTSSGAQGGDLDVFGRGAMVPDFDKVAFALKKGEISQPVKTQFGYHIIQVTDVLSFDELQQDMAAQGNPQVQKLVEDCKAKTPVQVDESYFGPPAAAPGAAGAPGAAPGAPGAAPGNTQQPAQPQQPGKQ
jgi:peptidyl-prolyl cis-trans isomerase C